MKIETKVTLQTSEAEGHRHERFFSDGTIPSGTYRTSEDAGHFHFFVVSEPVQPGESVTVETSPPDGGDEGHQHSMTVRAIEPETDAASTEEDARDERPPRHKSGSPAIETKQLGGHVVETKETVINGVRVGVIWGYIAAWSPDSGGVFGVPDQFERGAFTESLAEHRARDNRQIRLKDFHGRVIGGFPIETAREDSTGLWAEGHINLETQLGAEAWALIKQGVLTDLSIGFSALDDRIEDGIRKISKAIVWEGSVVDEPANRDARILEFRSALPFQDLPIADHDAPWDPIAALGRVRDFAAKQTDPDSSWKKAFVHQANGSLLHAVVDVVDDRLVVIPKAVVATAEELKGREFKGKDAAVRHLERYFAKMGIDSPFGQDDRQFVGIEEAKEMDAKAIEGALRRGIVFSKGAARLVSGGAVAGIEREARYGEEVKRLRDVLDECTSLLRDGRAPRS